MLFFRVQKIFETFVMHLNLMCCNCSVGAAKMSDFITHANIYAWDKVVACTADLVSKNKYLTLWFNDNFQRQILLVYAFKNVKCNL